MPRFDDDEDERRPRRRRPRDDDDFDRDREPARVPKKSAMPLILGILGGLFVVCAGCGVGGYYFLVKPAVKKVQDVAKNLDNMGDELGSTNNLRQIGMGMHKHADTVGHYPQNSYGPRGQPLLSWRVHILPYINEGALYARFKLDEPWDSPTNKPLLAQMPLAYSTPEMRRKVGDTKTYYRGFSHEGAVFQKPRPGQRPNRITVAGFVDGTTNTAVIVEAGEPVEWTKPDDLDFGPGRPLPPLGAGRDSPVVLVLMADNSIRRIKKTTPDSTWRALISYQGGEVVPLDE